MPVSLLLYLNHLELHCTSCTVMQIQQHLLHGDSLLFCSTRCYCIDACAITAYTNALQGNMQNNMYCYAADACTLQLP